MGICAGKHRGSSLALNPPDPDGRQLFPNVASNEIPNFPVGSARVSGATGATAAAREGRSTAELFR